MLRLILLPGMGGDARMFRPQLAALANATVPAWIEPQRGETLVAFAARMARAVDPGGPCFVGGSSFGGGGGGSSGGGFGGGGGGGF